LVGEVTARWGRVDIVVVNLGGPPPGQPTELSDDDWQGAFELSFYSAVGLCRRVLPLMRRQERGRIISILSLSVRQPEDNLALSTVARTAVAAFMKTLSNEVAREGITVNTVLPGSIATERLQGVWEMQARFHGRDLANARDDRLALVPAGRFGAPKEVADLICFLGSERASFLTGLNIPIDGGQNRATI
jgi:3-oxoacyl-[acyl-carrier protein] reductase